MEGDGSDSLVGRGAGGCLSPEGGAPGSRALGPRCPEPGASLSSRGAGAGVRWPRFLFAFRAPGRFRNPGRPLSAPGRGRSDSGSPGPGRGRPWGAAVAHLRAAGSWGGALQRPSDCRIRPRESGAPPRPRAPAPPPFVPERGGAGSLVLGSPRAQPAVAASAASSPALPVRAGRACSGSCRGSSAFVSGSRVCSAVLLNLLVFRRISFIWKWLNWGSHHTTFLVIRLLPFNVCKMNTRFSFA